MPIVISLFCEYVGQGETLEERWKDAKEHEKKFHKKELEGLENGELDKGWEVSF